MVLTRSMANKRMSEAKEMVVLMSLQREMAEKKKKNEEEILALQKENEEMKRNLTSKVHLADQATSWGSPLQPLLALRLLKSRNMLIPKKLRTSNT